MSLQYGKSSVISLILVLLFSAGFAWPATDFEVNVPSRLVDGNPIRDVDLFVDLPLATAGYVNFRVTRDPSGGPVFHDFSVNSVPGTVDSISDREAYADDVGTTPERTDYVTVSLDPATTRAKRFKIRLELETNWLEVTDACLVRQTSAETWKIETLSGHEIISACINSYNTTPGALGCPIDLMQADEDPAVIAAPGGSPIPVITPCADQRPPVDVMLVLDKSGSMNGHVAGGSETKIEALHSAVHNFVAVWNQTGIPATGDRLGVVLFNQDAQDWSAVPPGLNLFDDSLATTINDYIDSLGAGGSTSIGDGLDSAATHIDTAASPDQRKIILLMSDGMQNTERMAGVVGGNVVTYNMDGSDLRDLPGVDDLNIWSVTIGSPGTDIDPAIFQQIADTGIGFYMNSEEDADALNLFFLELLQNFLRFNTIQTMRLADDSIPITHLSTGDIGAGELKVATGSTVKTVSFSLLWDRSRQANVSMQITPPKGEPIDAEQLQRGPGFIRFTTALPLDTPYPKGSHTGEWTITISVHGRGLGNQFPYQFYALADDDIVKAGFSIEKKDYTTGDAIPLRVQLTEFRRALTNQDGSLRVFATLVKPEEGIGELLCSHSAASGGATGPDPGSATQQKLDALLAENPGLIKRSGDTIELFDDGQAGHGDSAANDGIFSNLYTKTEKQGHYNFLLTVQGNTDSSGPVARQHLQTVYVRLQPDPANSELTNTLVDDADRPTLRVSLTPRDRYGNRLGPGYANYFLVGSVNGRTPKFQDKDLNGVYEFQIPVPAGATIPELNIRFVKPFMHVSDEMYPDNIPAGLAEPFIEVKPPGKRGFSLHAGGNLPHGSLSSDFSGNLSYALDYEQVLKNRHALLLFAGRNSFDGDTEDLDITNLSVNLKYYVVPPQTRRFGYFANGGVGFYFADPGDDDLGLNIGGGAQFPISSHFGLEAWYNYHHVLSLPDNTTFSTIQLGVYLQF